MNEYKKACYFLYCVVGVLLVIYIGAVFGGCATKPKVGVTELAVAGSTEIGRLEQLDKQLASITERARAELTSAGDSTGDLATIIQRVFAVAFGLCDEIDSIRAENQKLRDDLLLAQSRIDNFVGTEAGEDNSGLRMAAGE